MKVVKFGGSSLSDAGQFKKVKEIIMAEPEKRCYIIPSAPGKRFSEDVKVTDMLYSAYENYHKNHDEFKILFNTIKERYNGIISELALPFSLEDEFIKIEHMFNGRAGKDFAASRGEYLNGMILASYLDYPYIDAAEVIYFNDDGTFDSERTNSALRNVLLNYKTAVIPGFYGSRPDDSIKTFSRGGSDVTGSIVARAIDADIYENWTDVSGFLAADPRIVSSPSPIDIITYRELRELSYMGATVLHEDAIFPVRKSKIPINIKNTNDPNASGTMIVDKWDSISDNIITGIAGKKGFTFINIEKAMMNQEIGFGRKVLEILENHGISFEHLPSGIDTMSVIIPTDSIVNVKDSLKAEIIKKVDADNVEFEEGIALIAIVGHGMQKAKGTAAKIFTSISSEDINIRMIDQGSSELNIIIGVEESDFEKAVKSIYRSFFVHD